MLARLMICLAALVSISCGGDEQVAASESEPLLAFGNGFDAVWVVGEDWKAIRVANGFDPDWSPDGRRLLYWTDAGLVVRDLHSGVATRILETRVNRGQEEFDVIGDWAPRKDLIAVLLERLPRRYPCCPATLLATIKPDGSSFKVLAGPSDVLPSGNPAWAADGRKLVYTTCAKVGREYDCNLVRVNADGRGRRRLLKRLAWVRPEWSPDGSAIAMSTQLRSGTDEGEVIEGSAGLYVLDLRSGRLGRIVRGQVTAFAWSPDSRSLAYTADGVRLVARDGGAPRVLFQDPTIYHSDIAWSPDGKLIAVSANYESPDERAAVQFIDAQTGAIMQTVPSDGASFLRWRPGVATPRESE